MGMGLLLGVCLALIVGLLVRGRLEKAKEAKAEQERMASRRREIQEGLRSGHAGFPVPYSLVAPDGSLALGLAADGLRLASLTVVWRTVGEGESAKDVSEVTLEHLSPDDVVDCRLDVHRATVVDKKGKPAKLLGQVVDVVVLTRSQTAPALRLSLLPAPGADEEAFEAAIAQGTEWEGRLRAFGARRRVPSAETSLPPRESEAVLSGASPSHGSSEADRRARARAEAERLLRSRGLDSP